MGLLVIIKLANTLCGALHMENIQYSYIVLIVTLMITAHYLNQHCIFYCWVLFLFHKCTLFSFKTRHLGGDFHHWLLRKITHELGKKINALDIWASIQFFSKNKLKENAGSLNPYFLNGFGLGYSIFSSRKINYPDVRFLLLALLFYPFSLTFSFLFPLPFLSGRTCQISLHIPALTFCKVTLVLCSCECYFKHVMTLLVTLHALLFSPNVVIPFQKYLPVSYLSFLIV